MSESFYPSKLAPKMTDNFDTPKFKELPVLDDSDDIYEKDNSVFDKMMLGVLVLGVLVGLGVFLYYVHEGKFQSNDTNSQNVNVNPLTNVSVKNDYSFNPSTSNSYSNNVNPNIYINQTIIIQKIEVCMNSTD